MNKAKELKVSDNQKKILAALDGIAYFGKDLLEAVDMPIKANRELRRLLTSIELRIKDCDNVPYDENMDVSYDFYEFNVWKDVICNELNDFAHYLFNEKKRENYFVSNLIHQFRETYNRVNPDGVVIK